MRREFHHLWEASFPNLPFHGECSEMVEASLDEDASANIRGFTIVALFEFQADSRGSFQAWHDVR